jgi:hypothetical protein
METNSRNTNVKHIRGTKAWKQTVETLLIVSRLLFLCVLHLCFYCLFPDFCSSDVFLLFVFRPLLPPCVLYLCFYCFRAFVTSMCCLETNSRNTNVKHIRGTKAWMCFTFVFLLFVSRLLFL